jgi:hypothetical protein
VAQDEQEQKGAAQIADAETSAPGLPTSGRRAFSEIRRQLSIEELSSPGVHKLIIEDLDRAEVECEGLRDFVERYHDADKRAAVLQEKVKRRNAFEVLHSLCLVVGGGLVGLAPSLRQNLMLDVVLVGFGIALIIGSSISKFYEA